MITDQRSGIYRFVHVETGRCYVGSSVCIKRRWYEHMLALKNGDHHSPFLQNAWDKYGPDAFLFEILEECDEVDLVVKEQFWMDRLDSAFNMCPAAISCLGYQHTEETKERMRQARLGTTHSDETKAKISAVTKGRKLTPEHIAKISTKGRVLTEEHRAKIGAALAGKPKSIEARANMSRAQLERNARLRENGNTNQ